MQDAHLPVHEFGALFIQEKNTFHLQTNATPQTKFELIMDCVNGNLERIMKNTVALDLIYRNVIRFHLLLIDHAINHLHKQKR